MPRKKQPIEVAKLKGATRKNPQRYPKGEVPKSTYGIGKPPAGFDAEEKKAWNEIVNNSAAGVLCATDRHWLEITAELLAAWRKKKKNGFDNSKLSRLTSMLGDMGMNPVARQRLGTGLGKPIKPEESGWAEFE